ncbi:MAG: valine--tRNA ligase [Candidatus Aenigmatarchaeota archaeon]
MKINEKSWDKNFEKPIYTEWKNSRSYMFDDKKRKIFSIDTPPPYVNTPIHIGHAVVYTLMDMFARFKRMKGYNVLFPLGLDRNGLPIEMEAEKKFNVHLHEVERDKFLEMCKKILEESTSASEDYFLQLGISFNSWEVGDKIGDMYLTDSPEYRALTQATFIELWNKGLIYEDKRINNYCPGCRTTIADAEVDYRDIQSNFVKVKFKVEETGEEITIGTTRPELICTCGMVIFNPADNRYSHLEGKHAITPIFEKTVEIRAHPFADMEKGTGIVMMCSAGDSNDIRFFREMKLEPTIAINEDGTMNSNAGFLEGMNIKGARKKIIDELKNLGLVAGEQQIFHRTPICERSKHEIEFIAMPEYYLRQVMFRKKMKELSKKMNFYSESSRSILLDWIDNITIDWPISRRRYYGTEIPLWRCKACGLQLVPEKGKYYQPWKEPAEKCKCGGELVGDGRVFDTWFDSSISPLYILHWQKNKKFFSMNYPCIIRPQGKEIVRNWLYYTLLKCYLLTGHVPFRDVWIHHHMLDEKGKKMSKSLKNFIMPKDVLDKHGAEPFRLWCALEGNITETDFRCSFERIEGADKTLTKLWNIARFISQFPEAKKSRAITATDRWILAELDSLIKTAEKSYEKYDFHKPATNMRHFLWETFASHYLELVKCRAYNHEGKFSASEQSSAVFTLYHCLNNMLKLMAPIVPFITQKLYDDIWKKNIHNESFPKLLGRKKMMFTTEDISNLNSLIWKEKKERGLSLRAEVSEAMLPKKFKAIEKDIAACHNIKKISYGKNLSVVI